MRASLSRNLRSKELASQGTGRHFHAGVHQPDMRGRIRNRQSNQGNDKAMNREIGLAAEAGRRGGPASRGKVFLTFTLLALQGFGGVLPLLQRNLVEQRQWLTEEEFLEDWAVAQILPGSNVFNVALIIGRRLLGVPGAVAAMAGMLVVPMLLALLAVGLFTGLADTAAVRGALRGMGIVSAGLMIMTSVKLLVATCRGACGVPASILFAVLTWYANAVLHLPLYASLLALGAIAWCWAYWRMPVAAGSGSKA